MSALLQTRTFAVQKGMSVLPPKADRCSALAHVCFGPKADSGADPTRLDRQMFSDEANKIFQHLVALPLVSLDLCERGYDRSILPPCRPSRENLDDASGKSDQRADLPGRFIGAGEIENQAATPGSK